MKKLLTFLVAAGLLATSFNLCFMNSYDESSDDETIEVMDEKQLMDKFIEHAEYYGTELKKFTQDCLNLEFVKNDTKIKAKIKNVLSEEKIDEYVKTEIEWFKNSLQKHERLEAPKNATKKMAKELEKINLGGFLNFFGIGQAKKLSFNLYGEETELTTVLLRKKNAPLIIETVQKLAKKMNIVMPKNIYLCDCDNCYMFDEDTLLLSKPWLKDHYDDEIETIIAHELAHSKTGTCAEAFDLLLKAKAEILSTYSDKEADDYKNHDNLFFWVSMYLLRATERLADTIAVETTNNPSAQIRCWQDDETDVEPEPRSPSPQPTTHPCTQERVGFGYHILEQQKNSKLNEEEKVEEKKEEKSNCVIC